MRNARASAPATHFLGVRLTAEEESLLEKFQTERDLPNRSEAVRMLVRSAAEPPAGGVDLPATLRNELEELVEDGFAHDLDSAVTLLVNAGIREMARSHDEDLATLREKARSLAERRAGRRRADREGRGFLRR